MDQNHTSYQLDEWGLNILFNQRVFYYSCGVQHSIVKPFCYWIILEGHNRLFYFRRELISPVFLYLLVPLIHLDIVPQIAGASGEIRTPDFDITSIALWPTELLRRESVYEFALDSRFTSNLCRSSTISKAYARNLSSCFAKW